MYPAPFARGSRSAPRLSPQALSLRCLLILSAGGMAFRKHSRMDLNGCARPRRMRMHTHMRMHSHTSAYTHAHSLVHMTCCSLHRICIGSIPAASARGRPHRCGRCGSRRARPPPTHDRGAGVLGAAGAHLPAQPALPAGGAGASAASSPLFMSGVPQCCMHCAAKHETGHAQLLYMHAPVGGRHAPAFILRAQVGSHRRWHQPTQ